MGNVVNHTYMQTNKQDFIFTCKIIVDFKLDIQWNSELFCKCEL